jgi:hypothetical protein
VLSYSGRRSSILMRRFSDDLDRMFEGYGFPSEHRFRPLGWAVDRDSLLMWKCWNVTENSFDVIQIENP